MELPSSLQGVVIITDAPFPTGYAPTNRIASYCSGFRENNTPVKVYCIAPTESSGNVKNLEFSGTFNGAQYFYTTKTTIKSKYFWARPLMRIYGVIALLCKLLGDRKSLAKSAVIIYLSPSIRELVIMFMCKVLGLKIYKEESEYPFIYFRRKKFFRDLRLNVYQKIGYTSYNGILVMTKNLFTYFRDTCKLPASSMIHVPMTVDLTRFAGQVNQNPECFVITYVGYLNEFKDGVITLLRAFAIVHKKHENVILRLVGPPSSADITVEINKLIEEEELQSNVDLMGSVSSQDIPRILKDSSILVLARPSSLQAEGGFPTKLGEYLATKNPVITTNVGEISQYLQDNVSAFIVEPDSVEKLAESIGSVVENYSHALEVGERGYEVALKYFNPKIQTQIILDYINLNK